MIDLHYWTTPNGHKITMFLERTIRTEEERRILFGQTAASVAAAANAAR